MEFFSETNIIFLILRLVYVLVIGVGGGSDCAVFAVVVAVVQDATKVFVVVGVDVEVVVVGVVVVEEDDHVGMSKEGHLCQIENVAQLEGLLAFFQQFFSLVLNVSLR